MYGARRLRILKMRYECNVRRQKRVDSSPSACGRNASLTRKCCFWLWLMCVGVLCAVWERVAAISIGKFKTAADMNLCTSHRRSWHANKPKMSLAKKWNAKKKEKMGNGNEANRWWAYSSAGAKTGDHESCECQLFTLVVIIILYFSSGFFLSLFAFNLPHRKLLRNLFHFWMPTSNLLNSNSKSKSTRMRAKTRTRIHKKPKGIFHLIFGRFFPAVRLLVGILLPCAPLLQCWMMIKKRSQSLAKAQTALHKSLLFSNHIFSFFCYFTSPWIM